MGKRLKRQPKPRYITIRIQYYPISRSIFVAPVIGILFFVFLNLFYSSLRGVPLNGTTKQSLNNKKVDVRLPHAFHAFAMTEERLANSGQVIFHGDRTKKEIALTFDADMTPGMKSQLETGEVASYYNKAVIDILNNTQTKATFFLAGMWIEEYRTEAQELAFSSLFELASHSYSHPSFHGECYGLGEIADNQNQQEIQKTQDLLQELTGITNTLFRFPGGCYSEVDVGIAEKNGLKVIQWDAAGRDGFNQDVISIEENVLQNVQNGSIIVLHMHGGPNAPKTAEALPKIIIKLKEQGYHFVTVSELLQQRQAEQAFDLKQLISYSL